MSPNLNRLNKTRTSNQQHGQSVLEFAMVLPLLLLIVFGIIEFGRAYYQYNTLTKAIRDGARYMSKHVYSATYETSTKNLVVYGNTFGTGTPILPGLTTARIVVTPAPSGATLASPPDWLTVSVNAYPFSSLVPSFIPMSNVTFSPSIQMRFMGANASY